MRNTSDALDRIVDNIEKVIIGKRETVGFVVISLACNGHVLIEDVPGYLASMINEL
ncbi:hypothetical protein [Desulfosporosinus lacus]|uniref:MoxR-like ATPase n=1 Tax=Desulfosporosinus lacus DSM 15449 TaxID=1121420 RepID=A0A1M5ZCL5_9FIRM|nr:hypothetical protein [Desulfosporosinus lacus]SHI21938.1 MoxR-like ATPase [Desulfosporosinus lacus DSM 15449]